MNAGDCVLGKEEVSDGKAALYATLDASFNTAACHYSQLALLEHDAMVKRDLAAILCKVS